MGTDIDDEQLFFVAEGARLSSTSPEVPGLELVWITPDTPLRDAAAIGGRQALVWRAFHRMRVFRNREHRYATAYLAGCLVHRALVTPPYFRFPFMAQGDVQVGDTWTHPDYRGLGIASRVLVSVVSADWASGRRVWYICAATNRASQRVAVAAGFRLLGRGRRKSRLGSRLLGYFQIESIEACPPQPGDLRAHFTDSEN